MSRRFPTKDELVRMSQASRIVLIRTLEEVLQRADESIPAARVERLRARIGELRSRNAEPERFLWHGSHLRNRYQHGGCSSPW